MKKFKQFFCSHRIRAFNTDVKIDSEKGIVIYTDTCFKCGKKFIHTVPYDRIFGEYDKIFKEIRK